MRTIPSSCVREQDMLFFFRLKITDYKGWARGLKKAGYATDPKYADRLISIIELYDLDQYDRKGRAGMGGEGD